MYADIFKAFVEITILSIGIYYILKFIRGTRGAPAVTGFFTVLVFVAFLATVLHLEVLTWILSWFVGLFAISVLVLFQPEIRRMLAEIGNNATLHSLRKQRENIEVIIKGARQLAEKRFGALIALERRVDLSTVTEGGVVLDCEATPEMLETIFFPNNAIHDGGVIMKEDRIERAAVIFPLSQRQDLSPSMGMRHRAGLGLSEETDAVVIIVSEETGYIGYVFNGLLVTNVSDESLRDFLTQMFVPKSVKTSDKKKQNRIGFLTRFFRNKLKKQGGGSKS